MAIFRRSCQALACGVALLASVGVGACSGSDEPAAEPMPTPTPSVGAASPGDPQRAAAEAVVRSLAAENDAGFAPEVLDAVGDQDILPPDAQVEPVPRTWEREGELATVEAIVHTENGGADRYGVVMENRDGEWLVIMTVRLSDDE